MLKSRNNSKRATLLSNFILLTLTGLLLNKNLTAQIFVACTAGYFLEGAIGLDDARLYMFEEMDVHGLEVVEVELLHSDRSNHTLCSISAEFFLLWLADNRRQLILLDLNQRVVRVNAILFCFYLYCELVNIALLKILIDQLQLSLTFILAHLLLFVDDKRISVFKSIFSASFKVFGYF